jgi:hypothetical protein
MREDQSRWISVETHLFHGLKKKFPIFAVFQVPNFQGHFEALNDVVWRFQGQVIVVSTNMVHSEKKSRLYLSNGVSIAPNEDRMQKL